MTSASRFLMGCAVLKPSRLNQVIFVAKSIDVASVAVSHDRGGIGRIPVIWFYEVTWCVLSYQTLQHPYSL